MRNNITYKGRRVMSKFRIGGLTLKPSDIRVLEDEVEDTAWREQVARLVSRREKKFRRAELERSM